MRIAIISDVHGNIMALTAVLEEIKRLKVDEIWCLGDIVGYLPHVTECVELVRKSCSTILRGNHEEELKLEESKLFNEIAAKGIEHAKKTLSIPDLEWLTSLPYTAEMKIPGRISVVQLAHGSFIEPEKFHYMNHGYGYSKEVTQQVHAAEGLVIVGHSHISAAYTDACINGEPSFSYTRFPPEYSMIVKKPTVLVVGSVGFPRNGDNRAQFMILQADDGVNPLIISRSVDYDIQETVRSLEWELGIRLLTAR